MFVIIKWGPKLLKIFQNMGQPNVCMYVVLTVFKLLSSMEINPDPCVCMYVLELIRDQNDKSKITPCISHKETCTTGRKPYKTITVSIT